MEGLPDSASMPEDQVPCSKPYQNHCIDQTWPIPEIGESEDPVWNIKLPPPLWLSLYGRFFFSSAPVLQVASEKWSALASQDHVAKRANV
jgi:hypothetical protein